MTDSPKHRRCALNAPGPFYTTGDCFSCGIPEAEAPDLLAPLTRENGITYFQKQPRTPEETERACVAIEVCCVNALRYGGKDRAVIQRLGNDPLVCDHVIDPEGRVVPGEPRWFLF